MPQTTTPKDKSISECVFQMPFACAMGIILSNLALVFLFRDGVLIPSNRLLILTTIFNIIAIANIGPLGLIVMIKWCIANNIRDDSDDLLTPTEWHSRMWRRFTRTIIIGLIGSLITSFITTISFGIIFFSIFVVCSGAVRLNQKTMTYQVSVGLSVLAAVTTFLFLIGQESNVACDRNNGEGTAFVCSHPASGGQTTATHKGEQKPEHHATTPPEADAGHHVAPSDEHKLITP